MALHYAIKSHRAEMVLTCQKAAERGVDLPEDVADYVESCHKAELQSIVDHHVDEHDVPGVLIEETMVKDKPEIRFGSTAPTARIPISSELNLLLVILTSYTMRSTNFLSLLPTERFQTKKSLLLYLITKWIFTDFFIHMPVVVVMLTMILFMH